MNPDLVVMRRADDERTGFRRHQRWKARLEVSMLEHTKRLAKRRVRLDQRFRDTASNRIQPVRQSHRPINTPSS
jgi:hypothetical protein